MSSSRWRDRVLEEAIDPALPIVDAHHHLWAQSPNPIFEPYEPEAMIADITTSGHNVVATICVDSHSNYRTDGPAHVRYAGETEFADGVAQKWQSHGLCAGIVGRADLHDAGTEQLLEEHLAASPRHFKGVRQRVSHDADNPFNEPPEMMGRADFREGLAQLTRLGLSFETSLVHPQLAELTDLARAFPETNIILDHIGGPLQVGRFAGKYDEVFAAWSAGMAELAKCENVTVKIGGMNLEHTGLSFVGRDDPPTSQEAAAKQREFALRVIDLFGTKRCMFESNFPVDKLGISYDVVWNAFKRMTMDFTPAERTDLFSATASRAYRLS